MSGPNRRIGDLREPLLAQSGLDSLSNSDVSPRSRGDPGPQPPQLTPVTLPSPKPIIANIGPLFPGVPEGSGSARTMAGVPAPGPAPGPFASLRAWAARPPASDSRAIPEEPVPRNSATQASFVDHYMPLRAGDSGSSQGARATSLEASGRVTQSSGRQSGSQAPSPGPGGAESQTDWFLLQTRESRSGGQLRGDPGLAVGE